MFSAPALQSRWKLTAELRQALRVEVDRRRRVALVEEMGRQAALDARLGEESFA
jgi:hypothetical protein